jgi:hypothetical protein
METKSHMLCSRGGGTRLGANIRTSNIILPGLHQRLRARKEPKIEF